MWMKDRPLSIMDKNTRGYFTDNGNGRWSTHCPYECVRNGEPCPMTMTETTTTTCKEIVDLYPAYDPIHMDPKQKYGVENIRYRAFRATDNN